MDIRKIPLTTLAPYYTTRRRGEEACKSLLSVMHESPVVLDLDDVDAVSLSFLDGLILHLMNSGHLDAVMFTTANSATEMKLGRLAGTRGANIRLINADGVVEDAKKVSFSVVDPKFGASKASLAGDDLIDLRTSC